MTIQTNSIPLVITMCAVLLVTPALAVDGEILINQAKVNAGGITPGDDPGFPATLSKPGRYKLTGNLRVPADKDGIEVAAHDVTVDLNGFTISSNPPGEALYGVAASTKGLRVMNGTIAGFRAAIWVENSVLTIIENMRLVSNWNGFRTSGYAQVRTSTIANNAFLGIECSGCLIEGNIVTGNGDGGVSGILIRGLMPDGAGAAVLGNVIVGNGTADGGYGIWADSRTGYGNNILVGNHDGGAQVFGDAVQLHPNVCEPACP